MLLGRIRCATAGILQPLARQMSLNLTPPIHRGMTVLDRAAFSKSIRLLGARVPAARTGPLLKADPLRK